jgi:hypothetical protein
VKATININTSTSKMDSTNLKQKRELKKGEEVNIKRGDKIGTIEERRSKREEEEQTQKTKERSDKRD